MFKFVAVCFFAFLAVAAAKPGLVAPLTFAAAPAAAFIGHASYVAPYASSYNVHHVAHSAAFPAVYAAAPVVHAAYANAPVVHAGHAAYASAPVVSAAYAAPLATPFATPLLLKK